MTRNEYEQRRRALDAQLAVDIELVRAAHEIRVRALESIWRASSEEGEISPDGDPVPVSAPPPEEDEIPETVPIGTQTGNGTRTGTQIPLAEAGPVRKGYGEVGVDLEEALARLPEVFDKAALIRELGYQPIRSTFYRALEGLLADKKIVIDSHSSGRNRTRYRKGRNHETREA